MHFCFYARGINSQIEIWKMFMQSAFWKWTRKNLKTKKNETILVQGSLRPSVLGTWEYVIPEPCLPELLAAMGIIPTHLGSTTTLKLKVSLAMMRKVLGVKKIPKKIFKQAKKLPASIIINNSNRGLSALKVAGIDIHPIGIRYDVIDSVKEWGYEQEML